MKRYVWFVAGPVILSIMALSCGPAGSRQTQVEVIANEMRFEPASLSVPAAEPVRLVLRNHGALVHDWSVSAPGFSAAQAHAGGPGHGAATVSVHAQPKRDATVEFTASEPGTYEYYCAEPGHKDAGMKGTITVR